MEALPESEDNEGEDVDEFWKTTSTEKKRFSSAQNTRKKRGRKRKLTGSDKFREAGEGASSSVT